MICNMLRSERWHRPLLALNLIVSAIVLFAFRKAHGGDVGTYTGLADGILHGRYSFWWELKVYIPDTFRNPGYPLFLAPFRLLTKALWPVQFVQFALYAASVLMMPRIIGQLGGGARGKNLFLLLLLPSFNIAYFNAAIVPEILVLFLITLFTLLVTAPGGAWRRPILLGLLLAAAFQCRSPLLLFPVAWLGMRLLLHRGAFHARPAIIFLAVFGMGILPYAAWNLRHHGVLKPTPLESGGGVLHMGWWSGKIPGHQEKWYWGNVASEELAAFVPADRVQTEVVAFNTEWQAIDSALMPLLTHTDSVMLDSYAARGDLFRTFNTRYTLAREDLLKRAVLKHMQEQPGYTAAHSAYTAVRLWVTGLQPDRFREAGTVGKLAQLYPFALTLGIFLLALAVVPLAFIRVPGLARGMADLWIWIAYFGAIHIPFAVQARYTIPVRMLLLALIALCIERLMAVRSSTGTSSEPTPASTTPVREKSRRS